MSPIIISREKVRPYEKLIKPSSFEVAAPAIALPGQCGYWSVHTPVRLANSTLGFSVFWIWSAKPRAIGCQPILHALTLTRSCPGDSALVDAAPGWPFSTSHSP